MIGKERQEDHKLEDQGKDRGARKRQRNEKTRGKGLGRQWWMVVERVLCINGKGEEGGGG